MLLRATDEVRGRIDVFHPASGGVAALNERLRQSFDPKGILNRGRMTRPGASSGSAA
jgi:glycolate oxidase FAD binding subunit